MPIAIGRKAFAAICAVEGLVLSDDAIARQREFDDLNLSNNERRRRILKHYRNIRCPH